MALEGNMRRDNRNLMDKVISDKVSYLLDGKCR
jgi:hypothetical protein